MPEPIATTDGLGVILSSTLVAGFLGSCISLRFTPPMNRWEAATSIFSGCVMAQYLTPLVTHYFDIDKLSAGVGFAIGLFGMSLTTAIYTAIRDGFIPRLIMSRWGNPVSPPDQNQNGGPL